MQETRCKMNQSYQKSSGLVVVQESWFSNILGSILFWYRELLFKSECLKLNSEN